MSIPHRRISGTCVAICANGRPCSNLACMTPQHCGKHVRQAMEAERILTNSNSNSSNSQIPNSQIPNSQNLRVTIVPIQPNTNIVTSTGGVIRVLENPSSNSNSSNSNSSNSNLANSTNSTNSQSNRSTSNRPLTSPVICKHMGSNGRRCNRTTLNNNELCGYHQPIALERSRENMRRANQIRQENRGYRREMERFRHFQREEELREDRYVRDDHPPNRPRNHPPNRPRNTEEFVYITFGSGSRVETTELAELERQKCDNPKCQNDRICGESFCYTHCLGELGDCIICSQEKVKMKVTTCDHRLCYNCYGNLCKQCRNKDVKCPFCRKVLAKTERRSPEEPDDLSRELINTLLERDREELRRRHRGRNRNGRRENERENTRMPLEVLAHILNELTEIQELHI